MKRVITGVVGGLALGAVSWYVWDKWVSAKLVSELIDALLEGNVFAVDQLQAELQDRGVTVTWEEIDYDEEGM